MLIGFLFIEFRDRCK